MNQLQLNSQSVKLALMESSYEPIANTSLVGQRNSKGINICTNSGNFLILTKKKRWNLQMKQLRLHPQLEK